MTSDSVIHLMLDNGETTELVKTAYDAEAELQKLLEDHPRLLPGDQIDSEEPRRWLVVGREVGIPDEQSSGGRWPIDLLFLDQDGIPTLIEVKQSSNTEIRRTVVGQMLDYVAHAVAHWSAETIQKKWELRCQEKGLLPATAFETAFGAEANLQDYWQKVSENLERERVRLLFVADEIPRELRRVVEFLNKQMRPVDVLAVEVGQYVHGRARAMVPRVHGQTVEAEIRKGRSRGESRHWDEESFFGALRERSPGDEAPARQLYDWTLRSGLSIAWGSGTGSGSFHVRREPNSPISLISVWTWSAKYGPHVQVEVTKLKRASPFDGRPKRQELFQRVGQIPGVDISGSDLETGFSLSVAALRNTVTLEQFIAVLEWVNNELDSVA